MLTRTRWRQVAFSLLLVRLVVQIAALGVDRLLLISSSSSDILKGFDTEHMAR